MWRAWAIGNCSPRVVTTATNRTAGESPTNPRSARIGVFVWVSFGFPFGFPFDDRAEFLWTSFENRTVRGSLPPSRRRIRHFPTAAYITLISSLSLFPQSMKIVWSSTKLRSAKPSNSGSAVRARKPWPSHSSQWTDFASCRCQPQIRNRRFVLRSNRRAIPLSLVVGNEQSSQVRKLRCALGTQDSPLADQEFPSRPHARILRGVS